MYRDRRGHKFTIYCPIKGCKYTSRIFYGLNDNKKSNHSETCPKHRVKLKDIKLN